MEEALALVDYDNLEFRDTSRTSSEGLEAESLFEIVSKVARTAVDLIPFLDRIEVRLYGGWTADSGMPTRRAGLLLSHIPGIPRRHKRTVVIPALATSLFESALTLRGTYRFRNSGICGRCRAMRTSAFGEQKMVDLLIGLDIQRMAERTERSILVFSDDEDLVPAFAAASPRAAGRLFWLRGRPVGSGPNDGSLQDSGVSIVEVGV